MTFQLTEYVILKLRSNQTHKKKVIPIDRNCHNSETDKPVFSDLPSDKKSKNSVD